MERGTLVTPVGIGREERPVPPVWFQDTIELWARRWGRHANTEWGLNCFVTHFSRRPNDPTLAQVQSGARQNVDEPYYWHEWKEEPVRRHPITGRMIPGFVALRPEDLGESGVLERLDKSNMWSGTGEFSSLEEIASSHEAENQKKMDDQKTKLAGALEEPLKAAHRHARGLATVDVPANIEE